MYDYTFFRLTLVLHDEQFQESDEGNDLEDSSSRDVLQTSNTGLDGCKGFTLKVDVSRNSGTERCVDMSKDGHHSNACTKDLKNEIQDNTTTKSY